MDSIACASLDAAHGVWAIKSKMDAYVTQAFEHFVNNMWSESYRYTARYVFRPKSMQ
jgi:hypothetical protein